MSQLLELLSFRAALERRSVAVQRADRGMTYGQLWALVRKCAARLRELGLKPGQLAVTSILDKELDWIFTLALAHEAVVSCSNQGRAPWTCRFAYDWLITDEPGDAGGPPNVIRVDGAWMQSLGRAVPAIEPKAAASAASPARLVLTSGTTGERKAVAMTEAQIMGRALDGMKFRGCQLNFSLMHLSGAAELNACVSALIVGAPVFVSQSGTQAIAMIRRYSPDGLFGSPLQIGELVRALDGANERLEGVRIVRMAGAAPTRAVIEAVASRITPNILCLYGSTEAGGMCAHRPAPGGDPAIVGLRHPGAQVEVVDENGVPVAEGEEGAVRVKTPFMVQGYHGDPEATAEAFRDGWFHPGDRGRFLEGGVLALSGRDTEVINRGGMKINPQVLDEFIAAFPGVRDAAVFVAQPDLTAGKVVAAIVGEEGFEMKQLRQAVVERFAGSAAPEIYIGVTHIPRNTMGKVQRAEMARMFEERRRARAA